MIELLFFMLFFGGSYVTEICLMPSGHTNYSCSGLIIRFNEVGTAITQDMLKESIRFRIFGTEDDFSSEDTDENPVMYTILAKARFISLYYLTPKYIFESGNERRQKMLIKDNGNEILLNVEMKMLFLKRSTVSIQWLHFYEVVLKDCRFMYEPEITFQFWKYFETDVNSILNIRVVDQPGLNLFLIYGVMNITNTPIDPTLSGQVNIQLKYAYDLIVEDISIFKAIDLKEYDHEIVCQIKDQSYMKIDFPNQNKGILRMRFNKKCLNTPIRFNYDDWASSYPVYNSRVCFESAEDGSVLYLDGVFFSFSKGPSQKSFIWFNFLHDSCHLYVNQSSMMLPIEIHGRTFHIHSNSSELKLGNIESLYPNSERHIFLDSYNNSMSLIISSLTTVNYCTCFIPDSSGNKVVRINLSNCNSINQNSLPVSAGIGFYDNKILIPQVTIVQTNWSPQSYVQIYTYPHFTESLNPNQINILESITNISVATFLGLNFVSYNTMQTLLPNKYSYNGFWQSNNYLVGSFLYDENLSFQITFQESLNTWGENLCICSLETASKCIFGSTIITSPSHDVFNNLSRHFSGLNTDLSIQIERDVGNSVFSLKQFSFCTTLRIFSYQNAMPTVIMGDFDSLNQTKITISNIKIDSDTSENFPIVFYNFTFSNCSFGNHVSSLIVFSPFSPNSISLSINSQDFISLITINKNIQFVDVNLNIYNVSHILLVSEISYMINEEAFFNSSCLSIHSCDNILVVQSNSPGFMSKLSVFSDFDVILNGDFSKILVPISIYGIGSVKLNATTVPLLYHNNIIPDTYITMNSLICQNFSSTRSNIKIIFENLEIRENSICYLDDNVNRVYHNIKIYEGLTLSIQSSHISGELIMHPHSSLIVSKDSSLELENVKVFWGNGIPFIDFNECLDIDIMKIELMYYPDHKFSFSSFKGLFSGELILFKHLSKNCPKVKYMDQLFIDPYKTMGFVIDCNPDGDLNLKARQFESQSTSKIALIHPDGYQFQGIEKYDDNFSFGFLSMIHEHYDYIEIIGTENGTDFVSNDILWRVLQFSEGRIVTIRSANWKYQHLNIPTTISQINVDLDRVIIDFNNYSPTFSHLKIVNSKVINCKSFKVYNLTCDLLSLIGVISVDVICANPIVFVDSPGYYSNENGWWGLCISFPNEILFENLNIYNEIIFDYDRIRIVHKKCAINIQFIEKGTQIDLFANIANPNIDGSVFLSSSLNSQFEPFFSLKLHCNIYNTSINVFDNSNVIGLMTIIINNNTFVNVLSSDFYQNIYHENSNLSIVAHNSILVFHDNFEFCFNETNCISMLTRSSNCRIVFKNASILSVYPLIFSESTIHMVFENVSLLYDSQSFPFANCLNLNDEMAYFQHIEVESLSPKCNWSSVIVRIPYFDISQIKNSEGFISRWNTNQYSSIIEYGDFDSQINVVLNGDNKYPGFSNCQSSLKHFSNSSGVYGLFRSSNQLFDSFICIADSLNSCPSSFTYINQNPINGIESELKKSIGIFSNDLAIYVNITYSIDLNLDFLYQYTLLKNVIIYGNNNSFQFKFPDHVSTSLNNVVLNDRIVYQSPSTITQNVFNCLLYEGISLGNGSIVHYTNDWFDFFKYFTMLSNNQVPELVFYNSDQLSVVEINISSLTADIRVGNNYTQVKFDQIEKFRISSYRIIVNSNEPSSFIGKMILNCSVLTIKGEWYTDDQTNIEIINCTECIFDSVTIPQFIFDCQPSYILSSHIIHKASQYKISMQYPSLFNGKIIKSQSQSVTIESADAGIYYINENIPVVQFSVIKLMPNSHLSIPKTQIIFNLELSAESVFESDCTINEPHFVLQTNSSSPIIIFNSTNSMPNNIRLSVFYENPLLFNQLFYKGLPLFQNLTINQCNQATNISILNDPLFHNPGFYLECHNQNSILLKASSFLPVFSPNITKSTALFYPIYVSLLFILCYFE